VDEVGLDSVRLAVQRYATTLYRLSQMTTLDIHYAPTESSQLIEETEDAGFADALRGIVEKARKRTHLQIFQKKEVTTQDGKARLVENPPSRSRRIQISGCCAQAGVPAVSLSKNQPGIYP
jgi:2,4-dienoyl-CoA reductase-like NADH-dependent reductase (Old Yellow Enzyme family)